MPLSRTRQNAWMRAYRAKKKAAGAVLMSKALVKKFQRLGVSPARYLTGSPVSLEDYGDLKRRYEAKAARVEWQSGGIQKLQEELGRARALLAMGPSMQDGEMLKRIAQVEADLALHEAEEDFAREEVSLLRISR